MPPKKDTAAKKKAGAGGEKRKREAKKSFAYDGKTVIVTATLAEIKKADRGKGEMDSRKLVRVPSKAARAKLYEEAASAIAAREGAALPGHGGRPWTCDVRLVDDSRPKRKNVGPLFRWYRGRLELAVVPHYLEKIEEVDAGIRPGRRHRDDDPPSSDECSDDEEEVDMYSHIPKTLLQQREVSALSTVAWEDPDHPVPEVRRTWRSPDLLTFHSRKAAVKHSIMLIKRDKLIDKVLHGIGAHGLMVRPTKVTRKAALDAGMYRFLRDGLFVVGQEEEWLDEGLKVWKVREANREKREEKEAAEGKVCREEGAAAAETAISAPPVAAAAAVAVANDAPGTAVPIGLVETSASSVGSSPSAQEVGHNASGGEGSKATNVVTDPLRDDVVGKGGVVLSRPWTFVSKRQDGHKPSQGSIAADFHTAISAEDLFIQEKKGELTEDYRVWSVEAGVEVKSQDAVHQKFSDQHATKELRSKFARLSEEDKRHWEDLAMQKRCGPTPFSSTSSVELDCDNRGGDGDLCIPPEKKQRLRAMAEHHVAVTTDVARSDTSTYPATSGSPQSKKKETPKGPRKPPKIAKSTHWRLTQEQIDACKVAVHDHYERVMRTIKARNLFFELADGFDVLRERGRGRYDMELPVFDTPKFDFLTDPSKAAWLPVVRKILGDDAVLVHKGAFLSLPGSDTQIYHQDGVHLNNKIQKACYAVNVFIPLVDLDMSNGPTEFCLGTHYLGYEHYAKDMCHTPTPKAGTPIIFDYRLGHRGLGNTSSESRPIVYLTYTPASKKFTDSVNFSRKRYKRLGELVEKPLSRRDRALKREREV
eukprot:CAMPEP_0178494256 /NCGR_PEP_ID=MMETSP0696-20121128/12921_1 /TAXON_ID=265572 /ORGANISM="Extubocellulus spinifer, Strain CCMP396" /LENGTH=816 /DNA_ID=CAMNT_0020122329 /DNA_START=291 /DNA_END=2741 /DNA_ORIENTATION=+